MATFLCLVTENWLVFNVCIVMRLCVCEGAHMCMCTCTYMRALCVSARVRMCVCARICMHACVSIQCTCALHNTMCIGVCVLRKQGKFISSASKPNSKSSVIQSSICERLYSNHYMTITYKLYMYVRVCVKSSQFLCSELYSISIPLLKACCILSVQL